MRLIRLERKLQHKCVLTVHMHADKDGGEAVLRQLSAKDRSLAELHMRSVDLSLRHIPVAPATSGCIITSEDNQSFRRWLYRWIRQTLERCPAGAPLSHSWDVCRMSIASRSRRPRDSHCDAAAWHAYAAEEGVLRRCR